MLTPVVAIDCSDDSNCCPPYGGFPTPPFDAAEYEQDSALAAPDVHVESPDASDASMVDAGGDAGTSSACTECITDNCGAQYLACQNLTGCN